MNSLEGHFLIAMPGLRDPNFSEAVTYLCKHDAEGALGIVINRESGMVLRDIYEQLDLNTAEDADAGESVLSGGPVQPDRGFVIHQSELEFDSTVDPAAPIKVTVSQDILRNMAAGRGPTPAIVALGYAGWEAGQLESELAANSWLSTPADPDIIFGTPLGDRWKAAAALLGVDLRNIASYSGHA